MDGNATEQQVTNGTTVVSDAKMAYDAMGRTLKKIENANATSSAQTTQYAFDADGRQTSMTAPSGTLTSLSYDGLGRTKQKIENVGTSSANTTQYTYDPAGRTLTTSNSAGTTTDSYDYLGRVSTEKRTNSANVTQTSVSNSYDVNGNLITSATSYGSTSSVVVQRDYDKLDRLQTLYDGTRRFGYDINGNVTNMQVVDTSNNNIVSATYSYDGGNRLLNQTDTLGAGTSAPQHTYAYAYNADGDRQSAKADNFITTYGYDKVHQLTQETPSSGATTGYTYDNNNNRTQMTVTSGPTVSTTTYSYDTSATNTELMTKTDPDGKVTNYTYDPASGNLTSAVYDHTGLNQTTTYTYDPSNANRLSGITKPDGTQIAFSYDANGQRTSVKVTPPGGGAASVVNDVYQLGHLAYQTDGNGTLLASFTYDNQGTPVSVQVGSDPSTAPRYYYVYNGHGDVTYLTDTTGAAVASYLYDAWGTLTSNTESFPGGANGWTNPYRYDGRDGARYDASDGLYWLSVRAYDPTLGRFLSRDPLGRAPLIYAGSTCVRLRRDAHPIGSEPRGSPQHARSHPLTTQTEQPMEEG